MGQLARDRDPQQVVYPMSPLTQTIGTPVRGPDHLGKGKHWLIFGEQGQKAIVMIKVINAHIIVTVKSDANPSGLVWESVEGKARKKPCIMGSWLESFEAMQPADGSNKDVFTSDFTMSAEGIAFFQVCFDQDLEKAYYPEVEGRSSGEVFVLGPDGEGQDKNFRIEGLPGVPFRVTLDLKATDRRRTVTWKPLQEEGMPFFPYVNA